MSLLDYQVRFGKLKPNRTGGHASPHKMCLILAVIELIESGQLKENKIYLDENLCQRFTIFFEKYKQGNDKDDPSQPFFYLESSGFWHHKIKEGQEEEYRQRIKDRKHGSFGIVSRMIEYAYFDIELFEFLKSVITRTVLLDSLYSNFDDNSVRFEHWALGVGKSEKTVKNYLGAIAGSISKWANEAEIYDGNILEIHSYSQFYSFADKVKKLDIFQVRDSVGKGMYGAALKLYGDFLVDTTQQVVAEDIENIYCDKTLDATEKAILVNTRIGQGDFRNKLIDYWQGCAVTKYRNPRLLVASHIKPWRSANNQERLDVFNGILLLPNLDKVFDLGYISFEETGKIKISSELEEAGKLGVKPDVGILLSKKHHAYLEYHRDVVFKC